MRRRTNAGVKWLTVTAFYTTYITNIAAVTWHTSTAAKALAGGTIAANSCGADLRTNGVFFSTDYGDTWARGGSNLKLDIKAVATYTTGGGTTYGWAADADTLSYNTDPFNASSTWSRQTNFPGGVISDLKVDANKALYVTTSVGIYKTTNNGTSWINCQANFVDASSFKRAAVNPRGADTVLAGSASNMYKSADGGSTWRDA